MQVHGLSQYVVFVVVRCRAVWGSRAGALVVLPLPDGRGSGGVFGPLSVGALEGAFAGGLPIRTLIPCHRQTLQHTDMPHIPQQQVIRLRQHQQIFGGPSLHSRIPKNENMFLKFPRLPAGSRQSQKSQESQ
jgi:hypothetical protein